MKNILYLLICISVTVFAQSEEAVEYKGNKFFVGSFGDSGGIINEQYDYRIQLLV